MEQIILKIYVRHRLRPLTKIFFESKESCKDFVDRMQIDDFITCSDVIIDRKLIKYVKIKKI